MEKTASEFYSCPKWNSWLICSDSQIGRFCREFLVFSPSNFAISRAKSMGAAQRVAAPKRSKVSDRVSVIVDDLEEEDDQASLDL